MGLVLRTDLKPCLLYLLTDRRRHFRQQFADLRPVLIVLNLQFQFLKLDLLLERNYLWLHLWILLLVLKALEPLAILVKFLLSLDDFCFDYLHQLAFQLVFLGVELHIHG